MGNKGGGVDGSSSKVLRAVIVSIYLSIYLSTNSVDGRNNSAEDRRRGAAGSNK